MIVTAAAMLRGRRGEGPDRAHRQLPVGRGLLVGTAVGLVGAGGGFLVVPSLALLGSLPMPVAVGTSLLVIAMKSAAGFAICLLSVRIDWALTLAVTGFAVVGSLAGARPAARPRPRPLPALRLVRADHGHLRPGPAGTRPHSRPGPRRRRLAGCRRGRLPRLAARCPLPRRLPSGAPGQWHAVPPRGMPRPLTALFTPGGIKYRYSCETEGTTP
nr:sulfite exporter TauE/SafE family protein [Streptomyces viridosporus]